MPKGISLHVGLNDLDLTIFEGGFESLKGCENDARDMRDIAESQGFTARVLLGQEATSVNVINAIGAASLELAEGDIFLFTFSGHGSFQLDPITGDEPDSQDEQIVLYDQRLLDDQLYSLWTRFNAGVRILFTADSCNSGTVAQAPADSPEAPAINPGEAEAPADTGDDGFFSDTEPVLDEDGSPRLVRLLPRAVRNAHERKFQAVYSAIRFLLPARADTLSAVKASLIQLSACQDFEEALDGKRNGLFTRMLREVWDGGAFQGTYRQFFEAIEARTVPFRQHPNFFRVGVTSPAFEAQRPFTI